MDFTEIVEMLREVSDNFSNHFGEFRNEINSYKNELSSKIDKKFNRLNSIIKDVEIELEPEVIEKATTINTHIDNILQN